MWREKEHLFFIHSAVFLAGSFEDWLQVFNLDDHKTEMSEMLVQNPAVRGIYTQLVCFIKLLLMDNSVTHQAY